MSLTFLNYDEAVLAFFKEIFPNVVYSQTDLAFKAAAKGGKDTVKLPLLSVFRTPSLGYTNVGNFSAFKLGHLASKSFTSKEVHRLRVLPLTIEYQLDVWADKVAVASNIFAEVLFYLNDAPTLAVDVEGLEEPLGVVMEVTSVSDTTDLLEEEDRGRLGRYSIIFTMNAFISKPDTGKMFETPLIDYIIESDQN